MREIKFRAWFYDGADISTGEMISLETAYSESYVEASSVDLTPTDKCTILMQYTGLKDKNGVEIYEGDVLGSPHFKDAAGRNHILKHLVVWSEKFHGWFLLNCRSNDENDGSIQLFVSKYAEIEVIGNIYEHPNLLDKDA